MGLLCAAQTPFAQSAHQALRQGDRAYDMSNYAESEEAYREAEKKKSDDPRTYYNTGNAIYQQSHYDESERYFRKTAELAKEPAMKADAFHNLGNAMLKQHKFQEAVDAYQNSLRARPGDPETKANLQLAKKYLKQQQQQNSGQQPRDQQQPSSSKPSGQQQQQGQNQDQQQQNPQPNQPQEQQQEQPSDGQMTREQARRMLETAVSPADQKSARKYRELDPGQHQARPKKDW